MRFSLLFLNLLVALALANEPSCSPNSGFITDQYYRPCTAQIRRTYSVLYICRTHLCVPDWICRCPNMKYGDFCSVCNWYWARNSETGGLRPCLGEIGSEDV